jgi:ubiquitin carboxyl-terminal hydrolase L3
MTVSQKRSKYYLALESNPDVFTKLTSKLIGVPALEFQDVLSIDEPELLAMNRRPALALVFVFPTTPTYDKYEAEDEAARPDYTGSGDGEDVIWFKQTIGNACGLYAILHSLCNGPAKKFIS